MTEVLEQQETEQGTQQTQEPDATQVAQPGASTEAEVTPGGEPAEGGDGKPATEGAEAEGKPDAKAEAEKPPKFSANESREIKRLHGALADRQRENKELREKLAEAGKPDADSEPARSKAAEGSDYGDEDQTDPRLVALYKRIDQLEQLARESHGRLQERDLREADETEVKQLKELSTASLNAIDKHCADLFLTGDGVDDKAVALQKRAVTALARGHFFELAEAEELDDFGLLTPENVARVAAAVREDYRALGALLATKQFQANEDARQKSKGIKSDAIPGVPKGKPLSEMNDREKAAYAESIAKKANEKVAGGG